METEEYKPNIANKILNFFIMISIIIMMVGILMIAAFIIKVSRGGI